MIYRSDRGLWRISGYSGMIHVMNGVYSRMDVFYNREHDDKPLVDFRAHHFQTNPYRFCT
jgi:hypothetical protein